MPPYLKFYEVPINIFGEKQWQARGYKPKSGAKVFAYCESEYHDYPVYEASEVVAINSERAKSERWKFNFDNVMVLVKKAARAYAESHTVIDEVDLSIDSCEVTDKEYVSLWGEPI